MTRTTRLRQLMELWRQEAVILLDCSVQLALTLLLLNNK